MDACVYGPTTSHLQNDTEPELKGNKHDCNDREDVTEIEDSVSDLDDDFFDPLMLVKVEQDSDDGSIYNVFNNTNSRQCHECEQCGLVLTQKSSLNQHISSVHLGIKPFCCKECGATFSRRTHLIRHSGVHTGEKSFLCPYCDAGFNRRGYLARHLPSHIDNIRQLASVIFKGGRIPCHSRNTYSISMNSENQKNPLQCSHCGLITSQKSSLRQHVKTVHSGVKPHKCQNCQVGFSRREHLYKHLPVHEGSQQHECIYCSATFGRTEYLARHIRDQCINRNNKKGDCSQDDLSSSSLCTVKSKHQDILNATYPDQPEFILPDKEEPEFILPVEAPDCQEHESTDIKSEVTLDYHFDLDVDSIDSKDETNKQIDAVICTSKQALGMKNEKIKIGIENKRNEEEQTTDDELEIIGEIRAGHEISLKRNYLSVPDSAALQCKVCSLHFTNRKNLRNHARVVHQKYKRFICEICNDSFTRNAHLKRHTMSRHSGLRPFHCSICHAAFSHKEFLARHSSVHITQRTVECPDCGSMFKTRRTMRIHRATLHHKIRPHTCTICSHSFSRRKALDKHAQLHNISKY